MSNLVERAVTRTIRGTRPRTGARMRALAKVRWVLTTGDGYFVSVDDRALATLVRDPARGAVYDGRDNEMLKAGFFEALLKVSLTVVLLDA